MLLFSACGHKSGTFAQVDEESDESNSSGNLINPIDLAGIYCAFGGNCPNSETTTTTTTTNTTTTTVYVAGYYNNGSNDIATVWKNGTKTDLPANAGQDSYAKAIYVSGGSVYVAGTYQSGTDFIPTVWKDGVKLYDLPVVGGGDADSIFIDSGNIYVAGNYWDGTGANVLRRYTG